MYQSHARTASGQDSACSQGSRLTEEVGAGAVTLVEQRESARLRAAEIPITQTDLDKWATWAQHEADRIDPVKNGTSAQAIKEHSDVS
jgi:hypothetical protein